MFSLHLNVTVICVTQSSDTELYYISTTLFEGLIDWLVFYANFSSSSILATWWQEHILQINFHIYQTLRNKTFENKTTKGTESEVLIRKKMTYFSNFL